MLLYYYCAVCGEDLELPNNDDKILHNIVKETNIPEPKYRLVNSNNILWTYHKE